MGHQAEVGVIVKVCRECGEEYRPEILHCADCGGELETRLEEERAQWPERDRRAEPPAADWRPAGDYQPILWSAYAAELTPLADRLVAAGVPFYLRPREVEGGRAAGYEIRVRQEERERALSELNALQVEGVTGAAGDAAYSGRAVPTQPPAGREASSRRAERCPACGASVADGARECPDCGLVIGDESEK